MTVATHRAAIKALIESVTDAGMVHDHEPYGRTEVDFRRLYAWTDTSGATQVRGWFVQRTRTVETVAGNGRTINVHTWRVRHFMSLDAEGATELIFDDLVEAVRRAYRADVTLGGAVQPGPLGQQSGFQVNDSGAAYLAGVLCHAATLSLTTHEYLSVGD